MSEQALSDLRVLDLTHFIAGPYCTKLLADLGAEVFKQLVKDVDILVENNPPGVMSRLGLDYQTLANINPQLVMTSITPFGQSGPYRDYKGHDLNLWHMGGMGYITRGIKPGGHRGPPVKGGGRQADFTTGLTAAVAIMCAMYSRQTTGVGQWIDVSELESVASMPQVPIAFPKLEDRVVGAAAGTAYPGGLMNCKDGPILIGFTEEGQWQRFIEIMGNPEWAAGDWWMDRQARIENAEFMNCMVSQWLAEHTQEELLREGQARHIPLAVPNSAEDVVKDGQFVARQFFVEIEHPETGKIKYPSAGYRFSRTPWRVRQPAPLLGEHNEEIYCRRLGYTKEELAKMRQCGVI